MFEILIKKMKLTRKDINSHVVWHWEPYHDPDSRDFIMAVKRNDFKAVQKYIRFTSRFLVFEFDECRLSALMWAVKRDFFQMSKFLIDSCSRVDWLDMLGRTPLHSAVKNDNLKMVKLLLLNKANPTIKCHLLGSPIDQCSNPQILKFLKLAEKTQYSLKLVHDPRFKAIIWQRAHNNFNTIDDDDHVIS